MNKRIKDLTNQKFGKLAVIEHAGTSKNNKALWKCICDCGTTKTIIGSDLTSDKSTTCGCSWASKDINPRLTSAKTIFHNHEYDDGDLTLDEFIILSQLNCHYCNKGPSNEYNINKNRKLSKINDPFIYNGLDRVNNNLKHTKNNVVPCCKRCNIMKGTKTVDEFKDHMFRCFIVALKRDPARLEQFRKDINEQ
jgi:hypothetical protein